jgi:O-acetyl-ADP-ribose deacetylase (regulator of RNase III)
MSPNIIDGDLLDQPVEVIVNSWNRNIIPWFLLWPHGVSGAIKRRAGFKPFWELGYRPLPLGQARLTSAGRLSCKAIIHVAGINALWRASEYSIRNSVLNAVKLAEEQGFSSLALPLVGAGAGSFSPETAEAIILETLGQIETPLQITLVRYRKRSS